MQTKPIFFDCDAGRYQLCVTTADERRAAHRLACDFCDFLTDDDTCSFDKFGGDCLAWDDLLHNAHYHLCHWQKVLPTSKSAKTPRAERGTIGKEVH